MAINILDKKVIGYANGQCDSLKLLNDSDNIIAFENLQPSQPKKRKLKDTSEDEFVTISAKKIQRIT